MVTNSVKGYIVHNMSSYKQLSTLPPPPLPKSVPAATNWIRQLAEKTLLQVIVLVYQDTNIIMCEWIYLGYFPFHLDFPSRMCIFIEKSSKCAALTSWDRL